MSVVFRAADEKIIKCGRSFYNNDDAALRSALTTMVHECTLPLLPAIKYYLKVKRIYTIRPALIKYLYNCLGTL